LTWDWPADRLEILGHATLNARVTVDVPVATVSVRLCDVFPDGRSTLIARGVLNLTHRDGHESPSSMPVGEPVDIIVELEATSWTFDPGHLLRLAICGTDWPNTIAPPTPVTLTVDLAASALHLPRVDGPSPCAPPTLVASTDEPSESSDVTWRVERDVLGRETACVIDHGSTYDEAGVTCTERYTGRVSIDTRTFDQRVHSTASFQLAWEGATVSSQSELAVEATADAFEVTVSLRCFDGDEVFAERHWQRVIPRDLG
jgi:uncharacterized protein